MDPDCFRGALLGLAVGDALGAPYELQRPPFTVERHYRRAESAQGNGSLMAVTAVALRHAADDVAARREAAAFG